MSDHQPPRQLQDLIEGQRTVMLTTVEADGSLRSRPMTLLEIDSEQRLWFFCEALASDAAFAARHARVNLAIQHPAQGNHVSVAGQGTVGHDLDRKRALWSVMARPWFPDGPESPSLATLCVTPQHIEYWDGPDSGFVRALAVAASVAAARPIGLGEHGELPTGSTAVA